MKHQRVIIMGILFVLIAFQASAAIFNQSSSSANASLGGSNGYIVVPSAEPAFGGRGTAVTAGYSAIFSGSVTHLPYLQLGFEDDFEIDIATEIGNDVDLLLQGKWRFDSNAGRSLAIGVNGQLLDLTSSLSWAVQLYLASTFSSTLIDWPSKTTVLIGYTLDGSPSTDIDFAMGFQTPFLKDVFDGKVDFIADFGNISYSSDPTGADASSRGLLNTGLRLLPVHISDSLAFNLDLRLLDVFDASGRALSVGAGLSYLD